jgi:LPXTG-motif cell wall-anchored protein
VKTGDLSRVLLWAGLMIAAAAAIAGVVIFRKRSSKLQNDFTEVLRNVQGLFAW